MLPLWRSFMFKTKQQQLYAAMLATKAARAAAGSAKRAA
jgi:hypothetical protein